MLNDINNYTNVMEKYIQNKIEELETKPNIEAKNLLDLYLQEYMN